MDDLLNLFLETATLKRMPRTGWAMRGVSVVESVAEHSYGVAWMALVLADALNDAGTQPPLDRERVLIQALVHDLGEVRLTDLPSSATRLISRETKSRAEQHAIQGLLAALPTALRREYLARWQEFEDRTTPEGRLVRDADKLEMIVQCLRYEMAGHRGLDEFWHSMDRNDWAFDLSARLYAGLKARHLALVSW
jgi:putative hydrolase of HD superfamily